MAVGATLPDVVILKRKVLEEPVNVYELVSLFMPVWVEELPSGAVAKKAWKLPTSSMMVIRASPALCFVSV